MPPQQAKMIMFQTPESVQLTNTIISRAPREIFSLINTTNNGSDTQLSDIIGVFEKEDINAIKIDLDALPLADLKTAKENFTNGLRQYLKVTGVLQPTYGNNDDTKDRVRWKNTLKRASITARDAYNCVEVPEDRIECFWIICCCAILTDSLQKACIDIRNWIDKLINEDEVIRKALKDLQTLSNHKEKSLQPRTTPHRISQTMTLETKDLLSSLFKRLRGALTALFYYYDRNTTFGHKEKKKLIRVLKKYPYLYEATKQSDEWKHINVYHYSSMKRMLANYSLLVPIFGGLVSFATSTVTFGKVKPPLSFNRTTTMERYDTIVQDNKRCETILETGNFFNAVLHKNDFQLKADMMKCILATQTEEVKCRDCMMHKSTLPPYKSIEWCCYLFLAFFTVLRFSNFILSSRHLLQEQSTRICAPIEIVCLWQQLGDLSIPWYL